MSTTDVFKAQGPSDAAGDARIAEGLSQHRLRTLGAGRWALIALCAFLIAGSQAAGSLLAPLLLVAIFLGRTRRQAAVLEAPASIVSGPRRPVTLH